MAQLGLGLGSQINGSNTFDPDALRYFATAGVTDATGRSQINTFVRGIKSLGLYSNMVCWPLRSTQNAGTGTTAYSLGGLGTYNGTLTPTVSPPTWGASGITFNGTTQYIEASTTPTLPKFSVFSITTSNNTAVQTEFSKDDVATNRELAIYRSGGVGFLISKGNDGTNLLSGPSVSANVITSICGRHGTSFRRIRKNNESDFSGSGSTHTQTATVVRIGCYSSAIPSQFFGGVIHASILFNTDLTDSQTSAVYALYQTSLGAGLGLPDADASAYIARAGVTDATGQQQINDFVVGVKNLGLYNNMVAWPLRSTQNAGTGGTAYSLGGLGTYDGTLTNGPTWGTGGVTFDGVNDYIDTTLGTVQPELTAISVTNTSSTTSGIEISKDNGSSLREFALNQIAPSILRFVSVGDDGVNNLDGPTFATGVSKFRCTRMSTSSRKSRKNNESDFTASGSTRATIAVNVRIGDRNPSAAPFLGVIHSAILFNKALTDSETSSMYTLYSTTIGSGLGLP